MTDEMSLHQMQSQQPIPVQGLQQHPVVYDPGVVNRNSNGGRVENYRWKQSKVLGVLQILIGSIRSICDLVSISVFNHGNVMNHAGYGFCISFLFFIAGIQGLVAAKKQTRCSIFSFMVICIMVSAFSTIIVLSRALKLASVASARGRFAGCADLYPSGGFAYHRTLYMGCPQEEWRRAIAAQAVMVCIAVTEEVVAIWGSAICCMAVGWCEPSQVTEVISIPQYSTQQTYPVDPQQAPFQQISYYALPTSNGQNGQNVQFLANTNQVPPPLPPTLDQNTEMTWNPPPYSPNMPVPTYEQATANKNGTFS